MSVKFRTTFNPEVEVTGSVTEREDLRVQGLLVEDESAPEPEAAPATTTKKGGK